MLSCLLRHSHLGFTDFLLLTWSLVLTWAKRKCKCTISVHFMPFVPLSRLLCHHRQQCFNYLDHLSWQLKLRGISFHCKDTENTTTSSFTQGGRYSWQQLKSYFLLYVGVGGVDLFKLFLWTLTCPTQCHLVGSQCKCKKKEISPNPVSS